MKTKTKTKKTKNKVNTTKNKVNTKQKTKKQKAIKVEGI